MSDFRIRRSVVNSQCAFLLQRYQFKATEFDRKIIDKKGMYGVKKIPESSTTEAVPFRFEIDARLEQRKRKTETQTEFEVSMIFLLFRVSVR